MAKYLRPRRGTLANADSQNLLLKKGELFFEYPVGNVGMAPAKLMIGNGITQYTSSNPVTTDTSGSSTNSFAPALVHPVLYRPKFTDSNPATSSWTFNSGTEAINNIKPWVSSSNPGKVLPDIIGNIKQALVNHADSLTKLNNDLSYMHYMDASTYDLDDFIFDNKQGIYVFKTGTELINGPEGYIFGPCTLQLLFNSADPVDDNIYAQQILYYAGKTYMRTCYWWQTSSTQYQTEWGEWRQSITVDYSTSGSWKIFKFGKNFAMACMATSTKHTPTATPFEITTAPPYISGYYPETYSFQASWAGVVNCSLQYNAMSVNGNSYLIDSYIAGGGTGSQKTLIRNVAVFYRQAT